MSEQNDDRESDITFRAFFATLILHWIVITGIFAGAWILGEALMCSLGRDDPAVALDRLSNKLPVLAFVIFASLAIGKVIRRDKNDISFYLPWDGW